MQIQVGLYTKKGETEEEVNELTGEATQKLEVLKSSLSGLTGDRISSLLDFAITLLSDIPDLTKDELLAAEKQEKGKAVEFIRLRRMLNGPNPTNGQVAEGLRQNQARGNPATLKQIDEGVRLNLPVISQTWGATLATMEQIDEGLRLKEIGIKDPDMNQINESLRLKGIGIKNPDEEQITVGLLLEKKDTPEEVEKLKDLYTTSRNNLTRVLTIKPSAHQVVEGVKLQKMLEHAPTKNEFSIGEKYLSWGKKFILAALYLYEQLGIKKGEPYLIKMMQELLESNTNATEEDLNNKLLSNILGKEPTLEERAEVERQNLNLIQIFQKYGHPSPQVLAKRIKQGLLLGPGSTLDQIMMGASLGGEATEEQIKAKKEVIERFEKIMEGEEGEEEGGRLTIQLAKALQKDIDLAKGLKRDQIDAWIYLRDKLEEKIGDFHGFDRLNKRISAVMYFKQRGTDPSKGQISEKIRLGEGATVAQVNASLAAKSYFGRNLSLEQVKTWIYLKDNFGEDIKEEQPQDVLDRYIPAVRSFITLKEKPLFDEIKQVVALNTTARSDLDSRQVKIWLFLRKNHETNMDQSTNQDILKYIAAVQKLANQGNQNPGWQQIQEESSKAARPGPVVNRGRGRGRGK